MAAAERSGIVMSRGGYYFGTDWSVNVDFCSVRGDPLTMKLIIHSQAKHAAYVCAFAAISAGARFVTAAGFGGRVGPPPFATSAAQEFPYQTALEQEESGDETIGRAAETHEVARVYPQNRPAELTRDIDWPMNAALRGTSQPSRVWPPPAVGDPASLRADFEASQISGLGDGDITGGEMLPPAYDVSQSASASTFPGEHPNYQWQLLPRGLMYQSYLAGPREPRFGYAWLYDSRNGTWVNDAAFGGRFGIFRYGDCNPILPEGWQLDVEGAAFPRLAENSLDLIATDYRVGIPLTARQGPIQWKLAYYHLSSHVGDEYLLNTAPNFDRINFSRNALVAGMGYFVTTDVRLYAETGYGFLNDGGNQPWEFQFGAEYRPFLPTGWRGAPFVAANAHLREEVDFGGSFNFMAGWAWQGKDSSYLLRAGMQYFNGHTSQFEFLGDTEELVGLGLWFDM